MKEAGKMAGESISSAGAGGGASFPAGGAYDPPTVEVVGADVVGSSVSLMSSGGGSGGGGGGSSQVEAGSSYRNPIYLTMGSASYKTGTSSSCWFKVTANGAFVIDAQASGANIRLHRIYNGVPQQSFILSRENKVKIAYPSGLITYFIHIESKSASKVSYKIKVYRHKDKLKPKDGSTGYKWMNGEPADGVITVETIAESEDVKLYGYGGVAHDVDIHPSEKWFIPKDAKDALGAILENDEDLSRLITFEDAAAYLSGEVAQALMERGAFPPWALAFAVNVVFECLGVFQGSAADFADELRAMSFSDRAGACGYRYMNGLTVCYGFESWDGKVAEGTLGVIGHFTEYMGTEASS